MYSTMFFPVVPFILHLVVVLWFALVALYLSSAGEKVYTINFDVSTHTLDILFSVKSQHS